MQPLQKQLAREGDQHRSHQVFMQETRPVAWTRKAVGAEGRGARGLGTDAEGLGEMEEQQVPWATGPAQTV